MKGVRMTKENKFSLVPFNPFTIFINQRGKDASPLGD